MAAASAAPCLFSGFGVSVSRSLRALPTETNVESGTSQRKSGASVDLSNSGVCFEVWAGHGASLEQHLPLGGVASVRKPFGLDVRVGGEAGSDQDVVGDV